MAGDYVVTFTSVNANSACSPGTSNNAKVVVGDLGGGGGTPSLLVSVGTGGGSVSLNCGGNAGAGAAGVIVTAIPTTIQ